MISTQITIYQLFLFSFPNRLRQTFTKLVKTFFFGDGREKRIFPPKLSPTSKLLFSLNEELIFHRN